MADVLKLLMATGAFFLGYIYLAISQFIFPPLVEWLQGSDISIAVTLGGIIWLGVILTWVLAVWVVPIAMLTYGLFTDEESPLAVNKAVFAVLWFLFSVVLAYFTYFWTTPMASVLTENITKIIFWIGYIIIWLGNIVVIPGYQIIKAKQMN